MTDALRFLQEWYSAHCDGDWEHEIRVRISTFDNPGWRLWINLADTVFEAFHAFAVADGTVSRTSS